MTILEFEQKHNVRLILKTESKVMRLTGFFLGKSFMEDFWTTFRLPFQKSTTIVYPARVKDPMKYDAVLEHELVHVDLLKHWYGPLVGGLLVSLFPLPILFSGRWWLERYAYLGDILNHSYDVDRIVDSLWSNYGWCWPKPLMKKWFLKKIKEHEDNK